tara:strand:+ start:104 stop:706 length:603 start_codon:yes stop_codon:yes gene_type:complete
MDIQLKNISKKFGAKNVISNFSKKFQKKKYAIIGDNGSGKSTLLKLISNLITPSGGKIIYTHDDAEIDKEVFIKKIIFTAPYQNLIEELTVKEFLSFHHRFRDSINNPFNILSEFGLENFENTQIKNLSSGSEQKLKLLISFNTKADFILLDEPTTNLDNKGINIYTKIIKRVSKNKGIIIATNIEKDLVLGETEIIELI